MDIIFRSAHPSKCSKRAFDFINNKNAKIHTLVKKPNGKWQIRVELKNEKES